MQGGPGSESVLQLLSHFKEEDGKGSVSALISSLEELSRRVQAADATSDPRLHPSQAARARDKRSTWMNSTANSGAAFFSADEAEGKITRASSIKGIGSRAVSVISNVSGFRGGLGAAVLRSGGATHAYAHIKVEDAQLPMPPEATSIPLPTPAGGHEWEALQAAVNDAVAHFSGPSAKMGWKKWALTQSHSSLLVSLFWWVVAAVFKSDHVFSAPIQDYVFGHFCRHYVTQVLRLKGKVRDLYQQVWIDMLGHAVLYLLMEVHPKSAHKFDDDLFRFITKQLRLWTAGALPSDLHPSFMAGAQDVSPAAFSFAQPSVKPPGYGTQVGAMAGRSPSRSMTAPAALLPNASGAAGAGPGQQAPAVPSAAQAVYMQAVIKERQQLAAARPECESSASSASVLPASGLRFTSDTFQPRTASRIGPAPSPGALQGMQVLPAVTSSTGNLNLQADPSVALLPSQLAPEAQGLKTQSFVTSKASPVMVAMLGDGVGATVVKGLHKSTLGGRPYMRRPLDEADEDISYKSFAVKPTSSAADAVAAYEATKKANAAEVASMRRALAEQRDTVQSRHKQALSAGAARIKDMSNRLSGWLLNDVDRALAGQPLNCEMPAATKKEPARVMAPLKSVRKVEANITNALSGSRFDSMDTACHVAVSTAKREAAMTSDWRPLASERVGTKDMKRSRAARTAMLTVDFHKYM